MPVGAVGFATVVGTVHVEDTEHNLPPKRPRVASLNRAHIPVVTLEDEDGNEGEYSTLRRGIAPLVSVTMLMVAM